MSTRHRGGVGSRSSSWFWQRRPGARACAARGAIARAAVEALEGRRLLATFPVTTTADGGAGSLRQAILDANAAPGADVITLPAGTYTLTLTGAGEDAGATGDLDITDDLTINGAGAATTTVNGNDIDRVFDVLGGADVTFNDLTITGGRALGEGGGIRNTGALTLDGVTVTDNEAIATTLSGGDGAGIFTEAPGFQVASGTTTIRNSTITDNVAEDDAGGIYHVPADGDLVIEDSVVSGNTATNGDAGGLYHVPGRGNLTVTDTTFDDNQAAEDAGGIYSVALEGNFTLTRGTITNNRSSEAGGIYHVPSTGDLTITDSTVADNTSTGDAGGIYYVPRTGDMTITGSTVSGNEAEDGDAGGIYIVPSTGQATIVNSTISGNSATGEGGGIYNNQDGTLLDSVTVVFNVSDSDDDLSGDGGGINASSSVTLRNSIVALNTSVGASGDDIFGDVDSQGHNLIQDPAGAVITGDTTGNVLNENPLIGSLADNGGPTLTHALLDNSPAIDAGDTDEAEDQRGVDRPQGADDDIGAFERGEIDPEPEAPSVSIDNVSQDEGDSGTTSFVFTVTRTGDLSAPSSVNFATAFGNAQTNASDLDPQSGTVNFAAGESSKQVTILVKGDTAVEPDDLFFVNLSNPVNAAISDGQGRGDILNDDEEVDPPDEPPALSINDVSKNEGNSGKTSFVFTVTRTGDLSAPSSVDYATAFGNALTKEIDLAPQSGTVNFAAGQSSKQITILVNGDTTVETDNLFFVNLSNPTNATIADGQGRGDILNDDFATPPPQQLGSIRGHVFDDRNGNLKRDGNEPALGGFVVFLDANENGKRDGNERTATSNSNGDYRFNNVPAGTHVVRIVLKSGYRQTKPPSNGGHTVNLAAGQTALDRGFGVTKRAAVSGTVFRDRDRDGKFDGGDTAIGNRVVFIDSNRNGKLDSGEARAVTDSKGRYAFKSVPAGNNVIVRIVLNGSTPTVGSDGVWHLNLKEGSNRTGINFGLR